MEDKISVGSHVAFKIDLRGFSATYKVIDINSKNEALIVKTHQWNTDPYEETWQPLNRLKLLLSKDK